jgi:hypothetical protein
MAFVEIDLIGVSYKATGLLNLVSVRAIVVIASVIALDIKISSPI